MPSIACPDIERTAALIGPHVRKTPVLELDACALKLEFMQHAGSFKTRGAFSNLLSRDVPPAGVVAASGGNHGAAVAYAAMRLGIPCKIFVPVVSSPAKVARIESYGAQLVVGGERYSDAYEAGLAYERSSGAIGIHAFDSPETIFGTGTLAKELEEQTQIDTVLVAVGGGGLIAGIASWFTDRVRVIAVEPEGAPTLYKAREAGKPVDAPAGSVANDSLAPRRVGELVFPIAQAHVDDIVLVSDDDIMNAKTALWEEARIVVEPGGAAAYGALRSGKYRRDAGERIAVVLGGANTVL